MCRSLVRPGLFQSRQRANGLVAVSSHERPRHIQHAESAQWSDPLFLQTP